MNKKRIEENKKKYVLGPRMTYEEIMKGLMGEEEVEGSNEQNNLDTKKEPKTPKSEFGLNF